MKGSAVWDVSRQVVHSMWSWRNGKDSRGGSTPTLRSRTAMEVERGRRGRNAGQTPRNTSMDQLHPGSNNLGDLVDSRFGVKIKPKFQCGVAHAKDSAQ